VALSLKRPGRYAPRSPRRGCNLPASLVLADDRIVPVTIENLSANGFMAKCDGELQASTWLGVELPGCGIVRARVRWNEDGELGCQFRRPIDLDRLGDCGTPPEDAPTIFRTAGAGRARPLREQQVS
jgi:hypothetical protein